MTSLRAALGSEWLRTRAQIALGLLFVFAAIPKLADPPGFAHMIYNYRLLPGSFVNLFALVLPWVELLAGVALLLGFWTRTSAALIALLLVVFTAAISWNLLRENAIDCGCFDMAAAGKSVAARLSDMRWDILRDAGTLALAAPVLLTRDDRAPSA